MTLEQHDKLVAELKTIQENQRRIEENQKHLPTILENQKTILHRLSGLK